MSGVQNRNITSVINPPIPDTTVLLMMLRAETYLEEEKKEI